MASEVMRTTVQQLFNSVQDSAAAYERCACTLWKQALENADTVYEDLRNCLTCIISVDQKSNYIERCIKFFNTLASKAPADNEIAAAFIEELLQQLASYLSAVDKTTRYRSCQLLQQLLSGLPEQLLLDEAVTEQLRDQLAERLQDKLVSIRVEAIKAISHLLNDSQETKAVVDELLRLAASDRSKDVRIAVTMSLPLYDATMPLLLARLRDENLLVRKAVLTRLRGVSINLLSIKQRAEVIQRALKDQDAAVNEAGSALLAYWLEKDCKSDPLALLRLLDVEVYTEAAVLAIGTLIATDSLQAPSSTAAAASTSSCGQGVISYIEASISHMSGDAEPGLVGLCCLAEDQLLEPHEALLWRCLCDWLRSDATDKGLAAAATGGARAALQASVAAERHEVLERVLPESADQLLQLVRRHAAAGPAVRFSTRQLLTIASTCVEWTDAASRSMALPCFKHLIELDPASETENTDDSMLVAEETAGLGLQLAGNNGDGAFEEAVVQLIKVVQGTGPEFCVTMLDGIAALAATAGLLSAPDFEHTHIADEGDSSRVLQCLAYIKLFLQQLPCGQPITDEGSVLSFSRLWELLLSLGLKQAVPEIRAKAVECIALYAVACSSNASLLSNTVQLLGQLLTGSGCNLTKQVAAQGLTDIALLFGPAAVDSVLKTPGTAATANLETDEEAAEVVVNKVLLELLIREGEVLLAGTQASCDRPKRGRRVATTSGEQNMLPASTAGLLSTITECLAKLLLHQRVWVKRYQACAVAASTRAEVAGFQDAVSTQPSTAAVAFPADSQQHQALLLLKSLQVLLLLQSHPATETATQLHDMLNTFFGVYAAANRNFRLQLVAAAVPAARQALHVNSKQNPAALLLKNVLKLMQDSYSRDQQQHQSPTARDNPVLMVDGSTATFELVALQMLVEVNCVISCTADCGGLPAKYKPYLSSLLKLVCELPLQPSTEDLERMLALCDGVCASTTDASLQKDVASVQQLLQRLAQDIGGVQQLQPDQINQLVASLQELSMQLPPLPDHLTTAGSRSTAKTPASRITRKTGGTWGAGTDEPTTSKAARGKKVAAARRPGSARDRSITGDDSSTDSSSDSDSQTGYSDDGADEAGTCKQMDGVVVAGAAASSGKAMLEQRSSREHRWSSRQPLGPSSVANL